jgi:phosphoserine phosphatase RsbX
VDRHGATLLEFAVASRSLDSVSGDASLVREEGGRVLVAVADGLGHGAEAARAAGLTMDLLADAAIGSPARLIADCHRALGGTRGVVLTVAVIDAQDDTMTWLAVGNVEGRSLRYHADGMPVLHSLLLTGGIVGHRLPPLRPATIGLRGGDVIALATDGIDGSFERELLPDLTPRQAATRVLSRCHKHIDDALVLVGRWLGGPAR